MDKCCIDGCDKMIPELSMVCKRHRHLMTKADREVAKETKRLFRTRREFDAFDKMMRERPLHGV